MLILSYVNIDLFVLKIATGQKIAMIMVYTIKVVL